MYRTRAFITRGLYIFYPERNLKVCVFEQTLKTEMFLLNFEILKGQKSQVTKVGAPQV
jgi:hypothetical protein